MQTAENTKKRRSAVLIMGQMIGLVKPLLHIMLAAILLGTTGYLCAIFLTILAGQTLIHGLLSGANGVVAIIKSDLFLTYSVKALFIIMAVMAVMRGILHYAEQYCNHFIAFKLLAIIRHKVFAALRRLCPAKLEGRDKGNLISIITTDIELLEVFYAHTISPIVIALLTSVIMTVFISLYSVWAGLFALAGYLVVGLLIPLWNGRQGAQKGMEYRTWFGELNSFVLDSLGGLDETIQYGQGKRREEQMDEHSKSLGKMQKSLSRMEGAQRSVTNLVILLFSFGMLFLTLHFYGQGSLGFDGVLICTISMMGSFGPVVALSSLSNNLNQTLASGERVLSILEERPLVEEIPEEAGRAAFAGAEDQAGGAAFVGAENQAGGAAFAGAEDQAGSAAFAGAEDQAGSAQTFTGAKVRHVDFGYGEEQILTDYSIDLKPGKIVGIHGVSGSGKSTLIKLLMRFFDVDRGSVQVSARDVREIPTKGLRDYESYVTQETHLFHDSIANNIAVGKPGAGREEIVEAAKKASIHDFIQSLPRGYDTEVGELGGTLSGGEKQRIGIARAFLHDAPFLLMDEPTSNLDSLNEGIILKSLKEACRRKTVVIVSHRKSTLNVADVIYEMENGRVS